MYRLQSTSLTLLSLFVLAACGPDNSPAGIAKANLTVMEELAETLAKITDVSSAKKHTGDLERIAERIKDLGARMEKAGLPSEKEGEKLLQELGPAMDKNMQQLTKEMMRIGTNPELQEILGPTLENLDF